jgi:MFS family permease
MDNQKCYKGSIMRFHWAAIFAGAFVGLGLGFLLNIFGRAIGLSAYIMGSNGTATIAVGGVLGLLIAVIVSMAIAGFVSGYLGRYHHCYCHEGVIYGFITWSMTLTLSALLILPLTHYVSFYEKTISPVLASTEVSKENLKGLTHQPNSPAPKALESNPKNLAYSTWILFVLFFLGAFSTCIGSCYGMRYKKEDIDVDLSP